MDILPRYNRNPENQQLKFENTFRTQRRKANSLEGLGVTSGNIQLPDSHDCPPSLASQKMHTEGSATPAPKAQVTVTRMPSGVASQSGRLTLPPPRRCGSSPGGREDGSNSARQAGDPPSRSASKRAWLRANVATTFLPAERTKTALKNEKAVILQRWFRKHSYMYAKFGPVIFARKGGGIADFGGISFLNGTRTASFVTVSDTASTAMLSHFLEKVRARPWCGAAALQPRVPARRGDAPTVYASPPRRRCCFACCVCNGMAARCRAPTTPMPLQPQPSLPTLHLPSQRAELSRPRSSVAVLETSAARRPHLCHGFRGVPPTHLPASACL